MPTQSGKAQMHEWILEFLSTKDRFQEQVMGWTGSVNMYSNEVKLRFQNREKATKFAKEHNLDYIINEPIKQRYTIKSYTNNYV